MPRPGQQNTDRIPYVALEWPRAVLIAVMLGVICWYMVWRLGTFNPDAMTFSLVLYGAEIFGALTVCMHVFMMWRMSMRTAPPAEAGSSVDVFIPTINEPVSVVRRTALTAIAMDYPHQTWILDDGNRPEVKALAEELGCGYIARPGNEHAKAGNLNYALARTQGEFIALFDADHAPKKTFLAHTLGYFRDPDVSFVQTPQDFYNLDSYQHRTRVRGGRIWTEQSVFFRIIQRGKDAWNAAFFCGSCAIMRRSHLEAIGGFATGTVTEDLHTSIKLHKAGYKSVYHAESLAYGVAAAQIEPFLKQRIRWGQGAMQVWRKENILFSRHLSWAQKICYLASITTYFEGWQKGIYYVTPALVLLSGWVPIATTTQEFLLHFVPYIVFSLWGVNELGRGYARVHIIEQYNMARFAAFAYATLGWMRKKLKFKVTNKKLGASHSQSYYLTPQYVIAGLNLFALPIGLIYWALFHGQYMSGFSFSANMFWAAVNFGLAGLVLGFTLRRVRYKRRDYRFAIPLTASVRLPGGENIFVGVDDVSSAGALLMFSEQQRVMPGQEITGHLRIPGEVIPFRARVRTAGVRRRGGLFTVGCEFQWDAHRPRQRLELFLYGSDLEWQVHHISERTPTLIESMCRSLTTWHELDALPVYENGYDHRLPLLYTPPQAGVGIIEPGILAISDHDRKRGLAMTFTPLAVGSTLSGKFFNQQGWQRFSGRVANENKMEQAGKLMYFYTLEREAQL